jgi:hypothetical protein
MTDPGTKLQFENSSPKGINSVKAFTVKELDNALMKLLKLLS